MTRTEASRRLADVSGELGLLINELAVQGRTADLIILAARLRSAAESALDRALPAGGRMPYPKGEE